MSLHRLLPSVIGTAIFILLSQCSMAQDVITTVAGTDWTFPASGIRAVAAPLGRIFNIAVGSSGNLYIADTDNHLVFRVSPAGELVIIAGNGFAGYSGDGGPATNASLMSPRGVAVDGRGNVYIADTDNNRIRKVDPEGIITTFAGNGQEGYAGDNAAATSARLFSPRDMVIDSSGNVYIADTRNHRIRRVSPAGVIETYAGTGREAYGGDNRQAAQADLNFPDGIAMDAAGNLFIADTFNHRIRKVATNGIITTYAGPEIDGGRARLSFPKDIVLDSAGNLYVTDPGNNVIRAIAVDGKVTTVAGRGTRGFAGDRGRATDAVLGNPVGLALDSNGNLYIGDMENLRVRRVTRDGLIDTVAGNGGFRFSPDGAAAIRGFLSIPHSIAAGPDGVLYIADAQNHRILKLSPEGILTTVAGNGSYGYAGDNGNAVNASLYFPKGVAVDSVGNIYIADTLNTVVRKVSTQGIITTFAGTGVPGASGENVPATQAQLNYPSHVATDANGNVYIADQINHKIRVVNSRGIISTFAGTGTEGFSGDGGRAAQAQLRYPYRVSTDRQGNVYIADIYNHRVRKVDRNGVIQTIAGTGETGRGADGIDAKLSKSYTPTGIVVDDQGNVYVAEQMSNAIRRIGPDGIVVTIAGNGSPEYAGDGRLATDASIYWPLDITFDREGSLYIVDSMNHRIRKIVKTRLDTQIGSTYLELSGTSRGAITPSERFGIHGALTGMRYNVSAETNDGTPWLVVRPADGTTPSIVQVQADPSQLEPGTYEGTLRVQIPEGFPAEHVVSVRFTVEAGEQPQLAVVTSELNVEVAQGAEPASTQVTVVNEGTGSVEFSADATTDDGGDWLNVVQAAGNAASGIPVHVPLRISPGDREPGTYTGKVSVTDPSSEERFEVNVVMNVTGLPGILRLSQTAVSFTGVEGMRTELLPQSVGVLNAGRGMLRWNAAVIEGAPWLNLISTNGQTDAAASAVPRLQIRCNPTGLPRGEHRGRIQLTSADTDRDAQFIDVFLTVLPQGSNLEPEIRPTGAIYTATVGGTPPGSQNFEIINFSPRDVTYTSSITAGAERWLKYQPDKAEVRALSNRSVAMQPDIRTLTPGVREARLSFGFSGGVTRTVELMMITLTADSLPKAGARAVEGCPDATLIPLITSFDSTAPLMASRPAHVEARVVDSCGLPVTTGSVVATFSNGDKPVELVSLKDGVWSGTWTPESPQFSVTVRVTAQIPELLVSGTATANVSIRPSPEQIPSPEQ